jgi:hypothetical protein
MISLPKATARLYGNTGHPIEKNPGRRGDKQRGDPISEPTRGTLLLEKVKDIVSSHHSKMTLKTSPQFFMASAK